jgi:hypothetical protein
MNPDARVVARSKTAAERRKIFHSPGDLKHSLASERNSAEELITELNKNK